MNLDPERQRQLHGLKLRALARDAVGVELATVTGTPEGAIGVAGDTVVALAETKPERGLGAALVAARRNDADVVHVLATGALDLLHRRAGLFRQDISIWEIDGRDARPFVPSTAAAATAAPPDGAPGSAGAVDSAILDLLEAAGVEVVVEHGVVAGEVAGLEVARIVDAEQGQRLEVGVGAHDREAFTLMHGDHPTLEALERVVALVRTHRAPGASPHPLNRLGAERWLRSRIIEHPQVVGAAALSCASPPIPRLNLKEAVPCVALGDSVDGGAIVVVCSTGIDLDVVPFAAHARDVLAPEGELVIAVPQRDAHRVTLDLAAQLHAPARVVEVGSDWRDWPQNTGAQADR